MNQHLVNLLMNTPGIIHTHNGIRRHQIDPADYVSLLTMKDSEKDITVGKWVRIRRGIYKGDVSLILAVETWGVEVLLVPRIIYHSSEKNQKRKATTIKPLPDLFDPTKLDDSLSQNLIHRRDGTYTLGSLHFVHGLLSKPYNYHSISLQVTDMPWRQLALFILSDHPNILDSRPPRPSEWSFAENDKITVLSSNKHGVILAADADYTEVEISSEGTHHIPWYDIQKNLIVGDYIRIISGCHQGKKGWATDVKDETAPIFIDLTQNKLNNDTFMNKAEVCSSQ